MFYRNTDRLFALWQAVYPQSNFTSSQVSAYDTLTIDAGQAEDINTRESPILAISEANMESLMFPSLGPLSFRRLWYSMDVGYILDHQGVRIFVPRNQRLGFKQ